MIDMQALLLDPVHLVHGVPAEITTKAGSVIACTVIDHRDGANIQAAHGKQTVLVPGVSREDAFVLVRHSQCPEMPSGGTLRIDGEADLYRIKNSKLKGRPGKGEWALVLERLS